VFALQPSQPQSVLQEQLAPQCAFVVQTSELQAQSGPQGSTPQPVSKLHPHPVLSSLQLQLFTPQSSVLQGQFPLHPSQEQFVLQLQSALQAQLALHTQSDVQVTS
jgi:hypothetical protein